MIFACGRRRVTDVGTNQRFIYEYGGTPIPKLRVHNFAMSLDGYVAGSNQDFDNPLGVGGTRLHEWVFETRSGQEMQSATGGNEDVDDRFVADGDAVRPSRCRAAPRSTELVSSPRVAHVRLTHSVPVHELDR